MSGFAERMDRIAAGVTAGSMYNKVTRRERQKIAPEILRLTEEFMN